MKVLITGGVGFIGCNVAKHLSNEGWDVIIYDNLSRKGVHANLKWLRSQIKFEFIKGDIRDFDKMVNIFKSNKDINIVIHLAAQVAVTTSIKDPRLDFETNVLGTFNLLEAIRNSNVDPIFLNASTNKVYGSMEDIEIIEHSNGYKYKSLPYGISENMVIDFHSPYGCSKGAADQYVNDYSRIYGLRSVNFRQSCIYGYHQFCVEEQGWIAWFTIATILNKQLTIYGDGKQVRDVLFIDDIVNCYKMAIENIDKTASQTYNIGGGPNNCLSLLELISYLERISNKKIEYSLNDWRLGDQQVFICDIRKAERDFGWKPKISPEEGFERLYEWVLQNKNHIEQFFIDY